MPRPALHLRNKRTAVKMVKTKGLSLRGPKGAVAISGRHFQFVQGADKNAPTDCVCSGAH